MGIVYGIDIYHKGFLNNLNYYSAYEVFTLKQLEEVLEKAIKTTGYQLKRISNHRLLLQYSCTVEKEFDVIKGNEQFTIENDLEGNKTIIRTQTLTPKLYSLLIQLSRKNKIEVKSEVTIPIYTLETMSQYSGIGNYWLVYTRNSSGLKDDAMQIANSFLEYNDFWEFTIFVENYGCLYFNNHTDQPADGFYNVIVKLVSAVEENNVYITLEESENVLDSFTRVLLEKELKVVSVLFQPLYKSYQGIKIEIEGKHNIEKLVKNYLEINIDQNKTFKSYDVQRLTEYMISVCNQSKKEKSRFRNLEINEAGLQRGLIYNKIYNKALFHFLCTEIAANFCPCSPEGSYNKGEKIIYYRQAKDKVILQKTYGTHFRNLIFKKV
ncbi:hypothetical protein [Flavobacterium phragmitis]|uniref:Uncharacterized protein n=1 Tax=Flavobacterium phragmitis TaxID=739143 RepID=A0A1I1T4B0_9FLAO|nr:hypothetical protein [Flavobacterium phragmitis]SFD53545.1 hypothetical protein SAMN05216297_1093 [Flavobacterium phragmitis]